MKHRLLIAADQRRGDRVTFADKQTHQILNVLRLRAGETVRVFDGVEPIDRVVVLDAPSTGRIVELAPQAPEPSTRVVAYPALLQRNKFESVLQKLTELGVSGVVPVLTKRALVREPPDEHRRTRWRAILREATEQSGRGVVPELGPALAYSAAIDAAIAQGTVLVAYEGERRRSVRDAIRDRRSTISIFVGPEGGYTPDEAAYAQQLGACLITLGPRLLRTETASPVLAALVVYELEVPSCSG